MSEQIGKGWIGVDLDGTLANYVDWNGGLIGEPVPAMLARVKRWIAEGKEVRIFTARVAPFDFPASLELDPENHIQKVVLPIIAWCETHIGRRLAVTCRKDFGMVELWDDRAVGVIPNRGFPHETVVAYHLHRVLKAAGLDVLEDMEYAAAADAAIVKITAILLKFDSVKANVDAASDALAYVSNPTVGNADLLRARSTVAKAMKLLGETI